jgi:hypothetical protein
MVPGDYNATGKFLLPSVTVAVMMSSFNAALTVL